MPALRDPKDHLISSPFTSIAETNREVNTTVAKHKRIACLKASSEVKAKIGKYAAELRFYLPYGNFPSHTHHKFLLAV